MSETGLQGLPPVLRPPNDRVAVADLGFARLDLGREARHGVPEVVYGPGKTPDQIGSIVATLLADTAGPVLVTRIEAEAAASVAGSVPGGSFDEPARLLCWRPAANLDFRLVVISAGTADATVAIEAVAVASALGATTCWFPDVGVAGIHRVLAIQDELCAADAVVCVAGMEGALASVVAGLVGCPVIAVPTSVGYGASLAGVTPLLGMLSSCAGGLVVVNIDSGFSAAMAAHRIAWARQRRGSPGG